MKIVSIKGSAVFALTILLSSSPIMAKEVAQTYPVPKWERVHMAMVPAKEGAAMGGSGETAISTYPVNKIDRAYGQLWKPAGSSSSQHSFGSAGQYPTGKNGKR